MKKIRLNPFQNFAAPALMIIGMIFLSVSCEINELTDDSLRKSGNSIPPSDKSIATIAIEGGFSELVSALTLVDDSLDAGLVDLFMNDTNQYTVFAPTNEAFEALYEDLGVSDITGIDPELVFDVLLYHVTEGRRASNSVVPKKNTRTIETLLGEIFEVDPDGWILAIGSESQIIEADISASNGIIHVIDSVLLPIGGSEEEPEMPAQGRDGKSIAEIAIEAGFSELVAALSYVDDSLDAGLVELFMYGTDQYTVFAPTNEAFEALYIAMEVDDITGLDPELVLDVLLYHVAEGRRGSNSVVPPEQNRTIETLLGETFYVTTDAMIMAIGSESQIIDADISASNGIVHVINSVLLPIGDSEEGPEMPPEEAPDESKKPSGESIAEIAIEAGFSELVAALTYVDDSLDAGLVELFMYGTDQYTVFAPTNEAFEALYLALGVEDITGLDPELVLNVLQYHVTEGRRTSQSVVPRMNTRKIETLLGELFEVTPEAVIIAIGNESQITEADISASNGIIHVIEDVLLPIP